MTTRALVVVAHGSADPRFTAVVDDVAQRIRDRRPGPAVRVGFLEHGPPHVAEVVTPGCVVVPLLLASGYHALVDLPAQAPGTAVTAAVGPDPRLAVAVADRLRAAGHDGRAPVVLAAAGSSDERALADVHTAAAQVAAALGVEVTAAFVSAGRPRVDEVLRDRPGAVVASYLVAPGAFHDALLRLGAGLVSEPLGDHPAVADVVLARYDETCRALDAPTPPTRPDG